MEVKSNPLVIPKTAHYYTLGNEGKHIKHIIIALHGYGQAARKFVHKFEEIMDEETLVVCPEGLSRFYWKGFTGDVVASWMTKLDREDEIKDNMNYLSSLYDSIIPNLNEDVKITLFGFSQGCPTMSRWASFLRPDFDNMILWAGQLAHDEDYTTAKDFFQSKELYFVYGNEDEFLPYGYKERQISLAKAADMDFEIIMFEGKHVVDRNALKDVFLRLKK